MDKKQTLILCLIIGFAIGFFSKDFVNSSDDNQKVKKCKGSIVTIYDSSGYRTFCEDFYKQHIVDENKEDKSVQKFEKKEESPLPVESNISEEEFFEILNRTNKQ